MICQDESEPVYKILTEKIEKIDNQYYVTFSYKSDVEKFPVVYNDVLDNIDEAYERLSEFKKEYEVLINPTIEYENYQVRTMPRKLKWAFGLIAAQIVYNSALVVEMGENFWTAIGTSLGAHILTLIAVFLVYKEYKSE